MYAAPSGKVETKSWWAVPKESAEEPPELPALRDEALLLLTEILQLKQAGAYKCMQLAASTLW